MLFVVCFFVKWVIDCTWVSWRASRPGLSYGGRGYIISRTNALAFPRSDIDIVGKATTWAIASIDQFA